jgi:hypothetical protein
MRYPGHARSNALRLLVAPANRFSGGPGRDRILAKDGTRESVDCGPGRDTVVADRKDRLRRCERVKRR